MDFTPIQTQEDFDNAIKDRINRLNEKHQKELSEKLTGFEEAKSKLAETESKVSELTSALDERNTLIDSLNKKIEEHSSLINEKDAQIKTYAKESIKHKISLEFGFSTELADRLRGETEEEMRADAEALKKYVAPSGASSVPPLGNQYRGGEDTINSAFKSMSDGLKKE